ncbi:MAG: pyridoxamine 5'-phosphate oxidase family protein [Pseudomonadota bacterium]
MNARRTKTPAAAAGTATAGRAEKKTAAASLPEDDLDAMIEAAWARLVRGAADKRAAFNICQVASIGAQGWPEQRSVVLRRADPAERRIFFHTDRRSTKAAEIEADGRVSLHFWDPRARLQLRLWGQARLLTEDPLADEEWSRLTSHGRQIYRTPLPPGRTIRTAEEGDGAVEEIGRAVFAAVPVNVMRLEWLHLRSAGHRRARFEPAAEGWQGRWLAP